MSAKSKKNSNKLVCRHYIYTLKQTIIPHFDTPQADMPDSNPRAQTIISGPQ